MTRHKRSIIIRQVAGLGSFALFLVIIITTSLLPFNAMPRIYACPDSGPTLIRSCVYQLFSLFAFISPKQANSHLIRPAVAPLQGKNWHLMSTTRKPMHSIRLRCSLQRHLFHEPLDHGLSMPALASSNSRHPRLTYSEWLASCRSRTLRGEPLTGAVSGGSESQDNAQR